MVCPTREQRIVLTCDNSVPRVEENLGCSSNDNEVMALENVLQGSKLPVCVIQRVLAGQKKEEVGGDDWLQGNIFHTRVEQQTKALNPIIDNGSGMNVISQEIVHKLKLPVEKHPSPYKLNWVDDTSILVKHQCLITFSLGKHYVDTLCCDVILMKVCHLLLGHPWLYDRRFKYDGYKNTYSFCFDNKKVVLQSMKIHNFDSPTMEDRVLTLQHFTLEVQECGVIFALVKKQTTPQPTTEPLPPKIEELLEEFVDITPEELPQMLPPKRDIQHVIDLMPGATLPNMPAYRISPFEHKETPMASLGST